MIAGETWGRRAPRRRPWGLCGPVVTDLGLSALL